MVKTTAPLYSHLSWSLRSPVERRYLGTWTASQTAQLSGSTSRAAL
jgi:hypothetical protein